MKVYVNGNEVELTDAFEVKHLADRLMVRTPRGSASAVAVRVGDDVFVSYRGRQYKIEKKRSGARVGGAEASGELRAPMPGQIVDVLLTEGDTVAKGAKILVLEAMKTQQAFTAPFDGIVSKIAVEQGQQVGEGAVLAVVSAAEQD